MEHVTINMIGDALSYWRTWIEKHAPFPFVLEVVDSNQLKISGKHEDDIIKLIKQFVICGKDFSYKFGGS